MWGELKGMDVSSLRSKWAYNIRAQAIKDFNIDDVDVVKDLLDEHVAKTLKEVEQKYKEIRRASFLHSLKKDFEASFNSVRLLKFMKAPGCLNVVVDAVQLILGQALVEGHSARLRARQCAKIIPLRSGKIPYTAGIKGHQGCVVGDSPSWADELILGLHGVPTGVFPPSLSTFFMFFTSLSGVEVPEAGSTEEDNNYINFINQQYDEEHQ
jgi:hypothetical protein